MRNSNRKLLSLSLAALGVVYGDIGTSPLYAFRECLHGKAIVPETVFGILSLIFWVLVLSISIRYLVLILRADNEGEGGIFALLALLRVPGKAWYGGLLGIAAMGAGLLIADGALTPAVSVLSAVEGLKMISPNARLGCFLAP